MYRSICALLLLLIPPVLLQTGCREMPSSPDAAPAVATHGNASSIESQSGDAHRCLGFWLLSIDTEAGSVEVVPARIAELHLNVTGVLNSTMGINAVILPSESDPANGLIALDVSLTHPFPTRPQLTGFDVKGVLMTPGSLTHDTPYFGNLVFANLDETRLLNADGYTRWWNPTEFTSPGLFGYTDGILAMGPPGELSATINPFKLFADILGPEDSLAFVLDEPLDSPQGRAVFTAGSTNTRRYRIGFEMDPGPQIVYGYAIDASWAPASVNPPVDIPNDFPIEANQPEAFQVAVYPTMNTLYYDGETGNGGGILRLRINVHDWQGQLAGDISGEVDALWLLSPDLMGTELGGADFLNEIAIKVRYVADLTGVAVPHESGEALLMCCVKDNHGLMYQQTSAPAPAFGVSAWQIITVDVADPDCAADDNNSFPEAYALDFGGYTADQLCNPVDMTDYFSFSIPPNHAAFGEIRLFSDAAPAGLTLYDESENQVVQMDTTDNTATIELDELVLMPGLYYIGVATGSGDWVKPYVLELDAELVDVEPDNPVELDPSQLYVNPFRVWVHDNHAYMLGLGVWVYDLTDPSNPVGLGYEDIQMGSDNICFLWPYCYFTTPTVTGMEVRMIDFSDPWNPVFHESVIVSSDDPEDVCMNSAHLYVGSGVSPNWTIRIYDYTTDPVAPTEVASIPTSYRPDRLHLLDAEGPDTWLLVATDGALHGYSVEDLGSISAATPYPLPSGSPCDMESQGYFIYLAYFQPVIEGFVYVMLLDPGLPGFYECGSLDLPGESFGLDVEWPLLYVADRSAGLTLCDVTFYDSPAYLGSIPTVALCTDAFAEGDTLCAIPFPAGFEIFDISTPASPDSIFRSEVINVPREAVFSDDYLIAVEYAGGYEVITTVDISDPQEARVVGEWFSSVPLLNIALDNDILAVAGLDRFMVLDASDPTDLDLVIAMDLLVSTTDIALRGDALYVATNTNSVLLYDVGSLPSLGYHGQLPLSNCCYDFTFLGDRMYLATETSLEVYSITDPFAPVFKNSYPVTSGLTDTEIQGNYIYMSREIGLEIADLSDPDAPSYMSHLNVAVPGKLCDIAVEGQYAYLVSTESAPQVFKVWPPVGPVHVGSLYAHDPYGGYDLLIRDGFLYEATVMYGLRIYDLY